ncbi:hypothetical protein [Seonamhaeicola sp.]|uniref:hypothetical protein n=1 Tax=Seonamhaeicola sp. TaxID=1912245 RepID=UPI00261D7129|nr:hypothetical protein [Seonamhaeicola sp.]
MSKSYTLFFIALAVYTPILAKSSNLGIVPIPNSMTTYKGIFKQEPTPLIKMNFYNQFLINDQGWRTAMDKYPLLTKNRL